jgi:hypothetical protein
VVLHQQRLGAHLQVEPAHVPLAQPGQLALDADELTAYLLRRLGLLAQPVGQDPPRAVVVGVLVNVAQQLFLDAHGVPLVGLPRRAIMRVLR